MRDIYLPAETEALLSKIEEAGYKGYVAGGAVRDLLRGIAPTDFDIATSAVPDETEKIFADCKTLDIGKKFGTITVFWHGEPYEITTFRAESGYTDGRRPSAVSFGESIEEDLKRRDFTINAMALGRDGLKDPFGGRDDLQKGIIRAVGQAEKRFSEDGLRIMRALRFASVLGFEIEGETEKAIFACKDMLRLISNERIRDELCKMATGKNFTAVLDRYFDVFTVFLPELAAMKGFEQHSKYHDLDVWQHTLKVIDSVPIENETVRIAALFHDVGKPDSFYMDDKGAGHFKGHEAVGAKMAREIMKRLRFSKDYTESVYKHILWHRDEETKDEYWIRKMLAKMGSEQLCRDIILLLRADAMAKKEQYREEESFKKAFADLDRIIERGDPYALFELAVDGNDMLELKIPNRKIGKVLNWLLEEVMKNPSENTRENLLKKALQKAEQLKSNS